MICCPLCISSFNLPISSYFSAIIPKFSYSCSANLVLKYCNSPSAQGCIFNQQTFVNLILAALNGSFRVMLPSGDSQRSLKSQVSVKSRSEGQGKRLHISELFLRQFASITKEQKVSDYRHSIRIVSISSSLLSSPKLTQNYPFFLFSLFLLLSIINIYNSKPNFYNQPLETQKESPTDDYLDNNITMNILAHKLSLTFHPLTTSIYFMASKMQASSTQKTKDSAGRRLGVKVLGDQEVYPNDIIARQRGFKWKSGKNVIVGIDQTIHARIEGIVKFRISHERKIPFYYVDVEPKELPNRKHAPPLPYNYHPELFPERAARNHPALAAVGKHRVKLE